MDMYYKRLKNSKSSFLARFLDGAFMVFAAVVSGFVFALVKFKSIASAVTIAVCAGVIAFAAILKIKDIGFKRFKNKVNKDIRDKLILENLVFNGEQPKIKGYIKCGEDLISACGKKAKLFIAYPKTVLTPEDILGYVNADTDEIIATCDFDEDCMLLCERKGIELKNKDFLLKNVVMDIDEDMIEREIMEEVKHISEIKKQRKSSVFKLDRRNKYLFVSLFLLFVSGFMGAYRIIYVAFGGMCMSFFFISSLLSKPQ